MQRRLVSTAALTGMIVIVSSPAPALAQDTPSEAELQARVAVLESTIVRLKQNGQSERMTERRAAEVRAIVQDVLADADTRASLLQGGLTAGWDKKFVLRS
ncbi:MAG: hypothetical protein ACR2GY_13190 [Phycisphaerales bacterium]